MSKLKILLNKLNVLVPYDIKKANYFIGKELWHIVATFKVDYQSTTYLLGMTIDGLLKDCKKEVEDYLQECEIPSTIYKALSSYYNNKYIDILKKAEVL